MTERKKVRNALDAMQPVIQEKFFAAEGNCAVVCRQMKDEHQIDINERRMRRFYVSSLNTFFYKFSRSKKMGTIRKEVPIFYLTASGRGSSL